MECIWINLKQEGDTIEPQKKIQLNNLLITVLICALFSCFTIIYVTRNKSPSQSNMNQNVNINTTKEKEKININTATIEELKSINNIGYKLAQRIIDNRPYKSIWDLNKIKGIGDNTIKELEGVVKCE